MPTQRSTLGRARRLARLLGREDGYAVDVYMIPAFFIFVLLILQLAGWFMSSNIAGAAANAAYTEARAYGAPQNVGQSSAQQVIDNMDGLITDTRITIDRTQTTVTVSVSGTSFSLIPFVELPRVERTVTGPTERWVPAP